MAGSTSTVDDAHRGFRVAASRDCPDHLAQVGWIDVLIDHDDKTMIKVQIVKSKDLTLPSARELSDEGRSALAEIESRLSATGSNDQQNIG